MSAATVQMAQEMIRRERFLACLDKDQAIEVVARKAGVSAGQIEGAVRGRVKDLKGRFIARIREAYIAETTREIQRLTHALEVARRAGLAADDCTVRAAKAAMARLQTVLDAEAGQ